MILKIPAYKNLEIKNIVFDLNGTIACDGSLISGVKKGINRLAAEFKIYILTADTFGTAADLLKELQAELIIIDSSDGSNFKADFVEKLGSKNVIAVGNGNNDALMLRKAELGIAVLGPEGTAGRAMLEADLISREINEALAVLSKPKRIQATLRK